MVERTNDKDLPSTGEILDGDSNVCGECGATFPSRSALLTHYQSEHKK